MLYKHLRYLYSNEQGLCQKKKKKDKIEILFNATTNLNDRLEDESLLLKAETVGSMLGVIENIASSAYIPVKVKGEMIVQYWKKQMYKDVYLRDSIELMTEEEQKQMMLLGGGDDGAPDIGNTEDDTNEPVEPQVDKTETDRKNTEENNSLIEKEREEEAEEKGESPKKGPKKIKQSNDLKDIFK